MKWNDEQKRRCVELYVALHTYSEIHRILGPGDCRAALLEAGVPIRRRVRRPVSQKKLNDVLYFYQLGNSIAECARLTGCGVSSVQLHLKKKGIRCRSLPWPEEEIQRAAEFYHANPVASLGAACDHIGRPDQRGMLRKYFRDRGIRLKKQVEVNTREDRHHAWKGGVTWDGPYKYIRSPNHPHKSRHGYVAEHRLKMEEKIGRYLLPGEVVHHIDGNPRNNDIENLQLFASNAEHLAFELKGRTPKWTEDGKRRIAAGAEKAAASNRRLARSRTGDRQ